MAYWILREPKETIDLTDIVGKVDFTDTPDGEIAEELLKSGKFKIAPFGYSHGGEFVLRGFSIVRNE